MPTKSRNTPKTGDTAKTKRHHAESIEDLRELHGFSKFAAGNINASLKAAEILSRGVRALNFNAHGAASMTVGDGLSATRAILDCSTFPQWIELQSELVKLNAGRAAIRALLLSVMAMQVTEEALFPLIRRLNAAHGLMIRTVGA